MLSTCIFLCKRCCCQFTETVAANDKVPVYKNGKIVGYRDVKCPQCGSRDVVYLETYSVG